MLKRIFRKQALYSACFFVPLRGGGGDATINHKLTMFDKQGLSEKEHPL